MNRTRIFTADGELELRAGEIVAYSLTANSVESADTFQSSYTNSFDLPLTRSNIELLGRAGLHSNENTAYMRTPCRVENEGIGIALNGFFTIDEWREESVTITCFDGIVDFFSALGGVFIHELDFSAYAHVRNQTNVDAALLNDYTGGYVYGIYDNGSATGTTTTFAISDLNPMLFIRTILDACATYAGFTFVDAGLYADAFFRKCVFPYIGSSRQDFQYQFSGYSPTANGPSTANNPFESFTISASPYFNLTTGEYTSPIVQIISFNLLSWFRTTGSTGNAYTISARLYSSVNGLLDTFTSSGTISASPPDYDTVGGQRYNYSAVQGEVFYADIDWGSAMNVESIGETASSDGSAFSSTANTNYTFENTLAEMKAVDFCKSVFKLFLAVPIVEPFAKTITLYKFEDIATDFAGADDWSARLDTMGGIGMEFDIGYSQRNDIVWEEDDSLTAPNFNDGTIAVNIETLPPSDEILKFDFSASESTLVANSTLLLAKFDIANFDAGDMAPRIAFVEQQTGGSRPNIDVGTNTNAQFSQTCFANGSYSQDLSFASMKANYWDAFAQMIGKPQKVTARFKLTKVQVASLDFTRLVWLNVRYKSIYLIGFFYLQKLVEYQDGQTTEVELVRLNPYETLL